MRFGGGGEQGGGKGGGGARGFATGQAATASEALCSLLYSIQMEQASGIKAFSLRLAL